MTVRFRMYRQGLGDCFLLSFDTGGGNRKHLLVDCGVLLGSSPEKMKMAVDDIAKTAGRLDWVVASHEHWDHISGFSQAKDRFEAMKIGEVWLAWTENPDDPQAKEIRADRALRVAGIRQAVAAARAAPSKFVQQTAERAESVLEFFGPAAAGGTSDAMDYIRGRVPKAQRRYLEPGDSFTLEDVPHVRVFVLGPPRNEKYLHKSRPSKKAAETYFRPSLSPHGCFLAGVGVRTGTPVDDGSFPFDEHWRVPRGSSSGDPNLDRFLASTYDDPHAKWRQIEDDWLGASGEVALQLDSDTNNTSLVLAIELAEGGGVILLPADAQVGNWLSWREVSFQVPSAKGGNRTVSANDLLARTVLYKVGHHGSHNATLRADGLEKMISDDLIAAIPVDSAMAKKKKWNMPLPRLYDRLVEKAHGRVLRIDEGLPSAETLRVADAGKSREFMTLARETDLYLEIELR